MTFELVSFDQEPIFEQVWTYLAHRQHLRSRAEELTLTLVFLADHIYRLEAEIQRLKAHIAQSQPIRRKPAYRMPQGRKTIAR